jgi:hypothetical protein
MHIVADYVHPHKDTGDDPFTVGYASTSLTTFSMLPWLSARSYGRQKIISCYVYPYKSRRSLWESPPVRRSLPR